MDPKNKYSKMWSNKEHKHQLEGDFNSVPKHFYTNFKTNLVRDAHYMAKKIVENRSMSPMMQSGYHLEGCEAANGSSI